MSLVLDLGIKQAGNVEADLEASRDLFEAAPTHHGYGFGGGAGNYCAVGAVSKQITGFQVPPREYNVRVDAVIQELYFAIPFSERVPAQRLVSGGVRQRTVEEYSDNHTKTEVVELFKKAIMRVRESERHRA